MTELSAPRFLDERVAHWAATKPDEEAITYLGRTWTWSQWNDRVRRLAGALAAWGVKRGDVVAFLDKNHPACVELTLAAASLGAANAIINFRLAADELDFVLNDCGAKVLIVGAELRPAVDAIADKLTAVEHVVSVTPEGGDGDDVIAEPSPDEEGHRRRHQSEGHGLFVGHPRSPPRHAARGSTRSGKLGCTPGLVGRTFGQKERSPDFRPGSQLQTAWPSDRDQKLMSIVERRFSGSFTPSPVATASWVSPFQSTCSEPAPTPWATRESATALARRSDRRTL